MAVRLRHRPLPGTSGRPGYIYQRDECSMPSDGDGFEKLSDRPGQWIFQRKERRWHQPEQDVWGRKLHEY